MLLPKWFVPEEKKTHAYKTRQFTQVECSRQTNRARAYTGPEIGQW